jgi:hypothetical protein
VVVQIVDFLRPTGQESKLDLAATDGIVQPLRRVLQECDGDLGMTASEVTQGRGEMGGAIPSATPRTRRASRSANSAVARPRAATACTTA